ncbi:alpha/beta hydrolase [Blastococcus saxobsidens]|uniref:Alpha/beta hydrolase n=1 Tax=Blastococcus saxobsidens TaxID=138336 RepID=A0A6L9W5V0_9ACTN|nr:alpha/beta fold hydrolase [Blastococcus saxobsidens]NEK87182.1 alpha/beta hydrolase [Blastococcus saxobsidens]
MLRRALGAAVVVALVCTVLVGLLWVLQRHLIYLPDSGPDLPAAQAVPGARDVTLTTEDGLRLAAWFVPGRTSDSPAVLVANGNGGHRGMRAPLARALADEGLAVLLFDYRGYAGNPGSPSEEGLARDARAARAFLLEEVRVPADRLVYFGESLGAAVATGLAAEHPPAGLVLRSPFVDLAAVGSEHYPFLPVRALLRDRYPVAEQVGTIEVPTIVVYGSADSIVPPAQSRAVADAAAGLHRVVEVPGADHNDLVLLDGDEVVGAVVALARAAG